MKTKQIGRTEVRVTEISFGCASIGNLYREASEAQVTEVLDRAWQSGIRYFDTAPHYGRGLSEMRLGAFLSGKQRDSYVISTKVGRVLTPGEPMEEADGFINPAPNKVHYDYSGDGIEEALEGSLRRLGTNHVEIVYVHDIGVVTHGTENARHMDALLGSGLERLVRLKEQGRIGAFGLGVNENEICLEIMRHAKLDAILLAGRLTLLDRSAEEELVPRCREAGTSLVLGGVFNSGILATGPVDGATYNYAPASENIRAKVTALQERAEGLGMSLAEASLQFCLTHPAAASLLLGTARTSSLERNLMLLEKDPPEDFARTFRAVDPAGE